MVLVRGDNEGVDLIRVGMGEEDKIYLVKSAIGQRKETFVVKTSGPDKRVGTGVVAGFDIGRSHHEMRFGFNAVEKMAQAQVHIIVARLKSRKLKVRFGILQES